MSFSRVRKKFAQGIVIPLILVICSVLLPQSVHAAPVPAPPTTTTTTSIPLSAQACAAIKKNYPSHSSDPDACIETITHKVVTSPVSNASLSPNSSCGTNGSTATAADQLKYSFIWIAELDTKFAYNGPNCTPILEYYNGFMVYTIYGTTGSTTQNKYTIGNTVTVIEDISTSTIGVGMHSCQERGDSPTTWPYYSVLGGGCSPF